MPAHLCFHARFDMMLVGASTHGGPGVSFNYGAVVSGQVDESGGGHGGLSVSLRSGYANVVEVRYGSHLLSSSALEDALAHNVWVPVSVAYGVAGLQVSCRGRLVVDNLTISGWEPQPNWRFALAARSSDSEVSSDALWLHHLRIESGSLLARGVVPVRVSLNGQQFHPTHPDNPPVIHFQAPPVMSLASPALGPRSGNSLVRLSGLHFDGGSSRSCRFGAAGADAPLTVPASAAMEGGALHLLCEAPPWPHSGPTEIRISLNGLQYPREGASYAFYEPLDLSPVSPTFGPALGGTRLLLNDSSSVRTSAYD